MAGANVGQLAPFPGPEKYRMSHSWNHGESRNQISRAPFTVRS